jgi:hypothetical protein
MHATFYLILEPGADRPYICHHLPGNYEVKKDAKVFAVELDIPGFEKVEGVIQLAPTNIIVLTERKMAPDYIEGTQFTCPSCASHYFGSTDISGEGFTYYCNGVTADGSSCKFSFPFADKDRYFKGTGHFSPSVMVATTGEP